MKKEFAAGAVFLLSLAVALTGCGDRESSSSSTKPVSSSVESDIVPESSSGVSTPESAPQYDDSRIEYVCNESGEIPIPGSDSVLKYVYQTPRIPEDTTGALLINEDIEERYTVPAQESLELIGKNEFPIHEYVTCETHWDGSILSIVMEKDVLYQKSEYRIYNYDFETGEALGTRGMISKLGISEEDFLNKIRTAALYEYDRGYADYRQRARTISESNINMDEVELYMDSGSVTALVMMAEPQTGLGMYQAFLPIDLSSQKYEDKSMENDFVRADLKDGKVSLTFRETEMSENFLSDAVEYGVPYPIEGLYDDCMDISLEILGQDFNPYLLMKEAGGQISFCNIASCARTGNRFFNAALPGLSDVEKFIFEDGALYGISCFGNMIDLSFEIENEQQSMLHGMDDIGMWQSEDGAYQLEYDQDSGSITMTTGRGITDIIYNYAGMTEEGLHYSFYLWDEDGFWASGVLTVPVPMYSDFSDEENIIDMTFLIPGSYDGFFANNTLRFLPVS